MIEAKEETHIFDEVFEPLAKRIINSLKNSDYDTLEELGELSDKELIKIKGVTKNSVNEIRGLLATRGVESPVELEKPDAQAILGAAVPVKDEEHVVEPGSGMKLPRRSGQVVMKINLYDPGFRRLNTGLKLSVKIGDVIWGNKDKEWDLPREKVEELIAKGDAA